MGTHTSRLVKICSAALLLGATVFVQNAHAIVNYTFGTTYSPNFDLLGAATNGTTGTTTSINSGVTPRADWFGSTAGNPTITTVTADDGSTSTDGLLNLGVSGGADRALGLQGQGAPLLGVQLQNGGAGTINLFTLSTTFEGWRGVAGNTSDFVLQYVVSPNAALSLNDSTPIWNTLYTYRVPAAGFSVPSSQTVNLGVSSGLNWAAGSYLYFRLFSTQTGDASGGFESFAFSAVPEPSTWIAGGLLLGFVSLAHLKRRKAAAAAMTA